LRFSRDLLLSQTLLQVNIKIDNRPAVGMLRFLSMWQLSIRSKIILTLLLTGLACLAARAIIGYRAGETALTRSVEERLTAQREIKRRRIESYVDNQLRFTSAIGGLPETTEATKALIVAYREMRTETQANPVSAQGDTVALEAWYNQDLLPRLDKVAGSHTPLEGLMPADPVGRRLQADYIARNPKDDRRVCRSDRYPGSQQPVDRQQRLALNRTGRDRRSAADRRGPPDA
jgi:hypothetical protein